MTFLFSRYAVSIGLFLFFGMISHTHGQIHEAWVENPKKEKVFKIRFFNNPNDGFFAPILPDFLPLPSQEGTLSESIFTENEQKTILNAFSYIASALSPPPAILRSPPYTVINLGHVGYLINARMYGAFQTNLLPPRKSPRTHGAHVYGYLGDIFRPQGEHTFSQLVPSGEGADLFSTIVHEFGHALFLKSEPLEHFSDDLNPFERQLWDAQGQRAQSKMEICTTVRLCRTNKNMFNATHVTFRGPSTSQVLEGSFPSVTAYRRTDLNNTPIPLPLEGIPIASDLNHVTLRNSVLSQSPFRNYSMFMEAELALLKDLGYRVDLRNFFGYSVYQNGQEIINHSPFFDRNKSGTEYKQNRYNPSPLGIGLHIYGSFNKITQMGNLLTSGSGAVGIRVDGTSNTVNIAPSTKIHANGINGRGLLVSYGSFHDLTLSGEVQALGQGGIGALFDLGGTYIGTDMGIDLQSYMPHISLKGPLVKRLTISGSLEGAQAAIVIGKNAHVRDINIIKNAKIIGDIISDYNQYDVRKNLRPTSLIFGAQADSKDVPSQNPDHSFNMEYTGRISGSHNLFPIFLGGSTTLTSKKTHNLLALKISPHGRLKANGIFHIREGNSFTNEGVFTPSNFPASSFGEVIIHGNYIQKETGVLNIHFSPQETALLDVRGLAKLNGFLFLHPDPTFYPDEWVSPTPFLKAYDIEGQFSTVKTFSPSLDFQILPSFAFPEGGRTSVTKTYHLRLPGNQKTTCIA